VNRDGVLSPAEVKSGMAKLHRRGVPVRVTARDMFLTADTDKNRKIDRDELFALMSCLPRPPQRARSKRTAKMKIEWLHVVGPAPGEQEKDGRGDNETDKWKNNDAVVLLVVVGVAGLAVVAAKAARRGMRRRA